MSPVLEMQDLYPCLLTVYLHLHISYLVYPMLCRSSPRRMKLEHHTRTQHEDILIVPGGGSALSSGVNPASAITRSHTVNPKLREAAQGKTHTLVKIGTFPGPALCVLPENHTRRTQLSLTAVFCPFLSPECSQHTNISPLTLNPALLPLSNSINIYDV